jgi:hypothetical protein
MTKTIIYSTILLVILGIGVFLGKSFFGEKENEITVSNHSIVTKIEALGKLETVKIHIKDAIKFEKEVPYWFNDQVLLLIEGDVTACIDLAKIDSSAIKIDEQKIYIKLPKPEICSHSIKHQNSEVYSITTMTFKKTQLVDEAYRYAEKSLLVSANKMNIEKLALDNAKLVLKPLIQELTKKEVVFN